MGWREISVIKMTVLHTSSASPHIEVASCPQPLSAKVELFYTFIIILLYILRSIDRFGLQKQTSDKRSEKKINHIYNDRKLFFYGTFFTIVQSRYYPSI